MRDAVWPSSMVGYRTGCPPTHVRMKMFEMKIQNIVCEVGRKAIVRCFDRWVVGRAARIMIEAIRASVPPNLFGIDRRIVYANRKYHSGLMCAGVVSGEAWRKFSDSIRRFGINKVTAMNNINIIDIPKMSLKEKYGWNGIISIVDERPVGLFDPVSWRNIKWIAVKAEMMNGVITWNVKNRVSVGSFTANPPQTH